MYSFINHHDFINAKEIQMQYIENTSIFILIKKFENII